VALILEAVALVAPEIMEAEVSAEIGAVAPERRLTHRNGTRPRAWEARVGEIELSIAKNRSDRRPSRRSWRPAQ